MRRSGNNGSWKNASVGRFARHGKASGCGAATLTKARTGAAAYANADQPAMLPVGGDITMKPRPIEQDVAYAGPGHCERLTYPRWLPVPRSSGELSGRYHLAFDLRRACRGHGAFRGSLHLGN